MTRRRVITDEMDDVVREHRADGLRDSQDRQALLEDLYDLIAVEVLEDVATDFIDWDVIYGRQEESPEVRAQHDTANYIGQVALEYRRGDVR